jgi:VIT1/CCC1 family predicted Fe2+/Mn2+ transporter
VPGGIISVIPYFAVNTVDRALFISIDITCIMLLIFGYCKAIATRTTKTAALYGSVQTLGIGTLTAGVNHGIVRVVIKGLGGTNGMRRRAYFEESISSNI